MRVAVVGSGIAGLSAARALAARHEVAVFERALRPGGHVHTIEVEIAGGGRLALDTGFLVFNRRNYPGLNRLFEELGVATQPSDMSFAVSVETDGGELEWAGGNGPGGLFAQRRRLVDPGHWRLLGAILRFNRDARAALAGGRAAGSLADFLRRGSYPRALADHYLVPMAAAIWSSPPGRMLAAPAATVLGFFANHGLLDLRGRPQWRTVAGGSARYVERLLEAAGLEPLLATPVERVRRGAHGVTVETGALAERFDACVLACHADEALALLAEPSAAERAVLGAFRFEDNFAYLHRDPAFMPRARSAWSSWNVKVMPARGRDAPVTVTYWLNRLQRLAPRENYFVSLNPPARPRDVLATLRYSHPVLDAAAVAAQARMDLIQGGGGIYFAGAWTRYGFHEDGWLSGLAAAQAFAVPAAAKECAA